MSSVKSHNSRGLRDAGTQISNYVSTRKNEVAVKVNNSVAAAVVAPRDESTSQNREQLDLMIGRIVGNVLRLVPPILFGGISAVLAGIYTNSFDTNDYATVISTRFIEGACFYLSAKLLFRTIIPVCINYDPGAILGAGLCGGSLGLYCGFYGHRKAPITCCAAAATAALVLTTMDGCGCA